VKGGTMQITDKTFEHAGEMLGRLMLSYRTKINEAFLKAEKDFSISLSLTIKPGSADNSVRLEAGINFVSERVKDTFTDYVDQIPNLFEQVDSVMCPLNKMVVLNSYCNEKCKDRETSNPSEPNAAGQVCANFRSCAAWSDHDTREHINRMLTWEFPAKEEKKKEKKRKAA